jgi:hypothetical protein
MVLLCGDMAGLVVKEEEDTSGWVQCMMRRFESHLKLKRRL